VVAGATVWAVLWNAGTLGAQAALPQIIPDQPMTHTGILVGFIGYSVLLSILAGFVTALVMKTSPMPAVWTLSTLQLTLGLVFEISYWNLMPTWYHLIFLALLIPATVYGGRLRSTQRVAVTS